MSQYPNPPPGPPPQYNNGQGGHPYPGPPSYMPPPPPGPRMMQGNMFAPRPNYPPPPNNFNNNFNNNTGNVRPFNAYNNNTNNNVSAMPPPPPSSLQMFVKQAPQSVRIDNEQSRAIAEKINAVLNPTDSSFKNVPQPPMPQPLAFDPNAQTGTTEWERGFQEAQATFDMVWRPVMAQFRKLYNQIERDVDRKMQSGSRSIVDAVHREKDEKLKVLAQEMENAIELEIVRRNEFSTDDSVVTRADVAPGVESEFQKKRTQVERDAYQSTEKQKNALFAQSRQMQSDAGATDGWKIVSELLHRGVYPNAIAYALIRCGRYSAVAGLLGRVLDHDLSIVNAPVPTADSWLIHRSCWDPNVEVVRALTKRGAITNRFNQYSEHPATTLYAAFHDRNPRCNRYVYEEISTILSETAMRGASFVDIAKKTDTQMDIGRMPLWAKALPYDAEDDQKHVHVTGIPFEYPMAKVVEWFSSCGVISKVYVETIEKNTFSVYRQTLQTKEVHNGSCTLLFETLEAVENALAFNNYPLLRRKIHVTKFKPSELQRYSWHLDHQEELDILREKALGVIPQERRSKKALLKEKKEELKKKVEKLQVKKGQKAKEAREKMAVLVHQKKEKKQIAQDLQLASSGIATSTETKPVSSAPSWVTSIGKTSNDQKYVILSNLPELVTSQEITSWCKSLFAHVQDVYVPTRALSKRESDIEVGKRWLNGRNTCPKRVHKGVAFLLFLDSKDVSDAIINHDGVLYNNQRVRVSRHKLTRLSVKKAKSKEELIATERRARSTASGLDIHLNQAHRKRKETEEEAETSALAAVGKRTSEFKTDMNQQVAEQFREKRRKVVEEVQQEEEEIPDFVV